jgi:plastocyanin
MDPDSPEFKEWAAKRLLDILALEEKERLAQEAPPEELREIYRVLDYEVAPILDASGVPITREELAKMFADWYVRRKAAPAEVVQAGTQPVEGGEARARKRERTSAAGRFLESLNLGRFGAPLRGLLRFVGIIILVVPLVLVPAYFFVSIQAPPPLASGVMALTPTLTLIAPGQTQNYTVMTLTEPGSRVTVPTILTAFAPDGLSFEMSNTYVSPQETTLIPVVVHASSALAPGPYQVTVEEREGSAVRNQTFTINVVPALVVMEHLTFVPALLNITTGTTVTWMNLDSTLGCCDPGYHDVAFRSGMNVTSPILKRLNTWSYTFETTGQFFYYCTIHPFMAAEVNVTA